MTTASCMAEIVLRGSVLSRGVAIGPLFFFTPQKETVVLEKSVKSSEVKGECVRFYKALEKSAIDVERIKNDLERERVQEGVAILEAHLQIMRDPGLIQSTEKEIRTLKTAEFAFKTVIDKYLKRFEALSDPHFRERANDLIDISRRIMGHLREYEFNHLDKLSEPSLLVADEFQASIIAELNPREALGLITSQGSATSHAAILARAKGIPFLASVDLALLKQQPAPSVILDAREGKVIANPSIKSLTAFLRVKEKLETHTKILQMSRGLKAETFDGYEVRLSANIDVDTELELLHQYGGQGVGLFRSEYVFLKHEKFPSEEEQYHIYKGIVEKTQGLPIVIRSFDVGGDKGTLPIHHHEENPYLGCRAIRFLLKEKNIFKAQLRAILRAALFGDVSLMFPMVSGLSELTEAKSVLAQVEKELTLELIPHKKNIRIGSMIEVPSAAIISDLLAKECDFLSIGTNDLVQYSLAVDRGNQHLSNFYTPSHPGVLRLIKMIVTEANRQGIPVTVCGEIAADPRFTPLLLGLGVHELSVSSRYIPIVKQMVRSTSIVQASHLAEKALSLGSPHEIEELLELEYRKTAPEPLITSELIS